MFHTQKKKCCHEQRTEIIDLTYRDSIKARLLVSYLSEDRHVARHFWGSKVESFITICNNSWVHRSRYSYNMLAWRSCTWVVWECWRTIDNLKGSFNLLKALKCFNVNHLLALGMVYETTFLWAEELWMEIAVMELGSILRNFQKARWLLSSLTASVAKISFQKYLMNDSDRENTFEWREKSRDIWYLYSLSLQSKIFSISVVITVLKTCNSQHVDAEIHRPSC